MDRFGLIWSISVVRVILSSHQISWRCQFDTFEPFLNPQHSSSWDFKLFWVQMPRQKFQFLDIYEKQRASLVSNIDSFNILIQNHQNLFSRIHEYSASCRDGWILLFGAYKKLLYQENEEIYCTGVQKWNVLKLDSTFENCSQYGRKPLSFGCSRFLLTNPC